MLPGEIPGTVAVLTRLSESGVPLYGITNFSSEKFLEARKRWPFFSLFRDIVVSGDERLLKPEAAIFHLCLQRNGLKAEDCVFVDDVARNIDGLPTAPYLLRPAPCECDSCPQIGLRTRCS
jgi:2-haloacid dehalogenase